MLLFDVSDDPKYGEYGIANGNVLYELGIANTIRNPEEILIIRNSLSTGKTFDISQLKYIKYEELTIEWLSEILNKSIENHKWHRQKLIENTKSLLDIESLKFIYIFGPAKKPDNFYLPDPPPIEHRLAVFRLLDLGLIVSASKKTESGFEQSYHWTQLAYELMKYMGIQKIS